MKPLWLAMFGWLIIILVVLAIALLIRSQHDKRPLLIDAALPVAGANRLFVPCPLTPRNIPNHSQRNA